MSKRLTPPDDWAETLPPLLKSARTANDLRQVLCVWMRLALGMSKEQIAIATGWSASTIRQVQERFLREGVAAFQGPGKGGRRNELMTRQSEYALLRRLREENFPNEVLEFHAVHRAVENAVGREVPVSTVHRLLKRHGWRRVARVFIPHSGPLAPGANDAQKKLATDSMSKVAADLRARAVQGDDMDKLQIEAYAQAGIERTQVGTKLEQVRRTTLPPQHESVMNLKPGEVSEVLSDPEGAHFIYKMIDKSTLTPEQAKPEMRSAISTERYRDSVKAFQEDVVFTDAYFDPPAKAVKPSVRGHKTKAND